MITELSCKEFAKELASKKPVPGGGGVAALVSALGVALNTMVANFSYGKKKFLDVKGKHEDLINRGELLREKLIKLIDKDAECFEPLSRAYALPSATEEEKRIKNAELQNCLIVACATPMEVLEYSYEAVMLHKGIIDISSKNIISDVGVGVQCIKAAMNSAYLNVLINSQLMEDVNYANTQREKAEKLVCEGTIIADELFDKVVKILNEQ